MTTWDIFLIGLKILNLIPAPTCVVYKSWCKTKVFILTFICFNIFQDARKVAADTTLVQVISVWFITNKNIRAQLRILRCIAIVK